MMWKGAIMHRSAFESSTGDCDIDDALAKEKPLTTCMRFSRVLTRGIMRY